MPGHGDRTQRDMARLAAQVLVLLGVAAVLGLVTNALRSEGIDWGGRDPERFRHADVEFLSVKAAAPLHSQTTTLFLDARSGEEFAAAHVFGAVSLPADATDAAYAELRDFLAPDMDLVVYAGDTMSAVRVAKFLLARGLRARVLEGGWEAWRDERLPVE